MRIMFIITIIAVLQLESVSSLSIHDRECERYLEKFGGPDFQDGATFSKVSLSGDVSFIAGTANAKIDISYFDFNLFNHPIYFGLVKEDGKTEDQVCLELKLWQYTSSTFDNPVQVTDLTITPSSNSEKRQRYYSFIIPQNEFKARLVETSNSDQFIYAGYYSIAFYAVGTDMLQETFFFKFSLSIDKATGAALESSFESLSNNYIFYHKSEDYSVEWCTDLSCTEFATPDLHLNDEFILRQIFADDYGSRLYLTNTQVWYTGNGLLKRASPIFIYNATPGQVIIKFKAEIAWREVTIKVMSTLSLLQAGRRKWDEQIEFIQLSGEAKQIECIKAEGSDECATCEQEFEANGFAHDGCERQQSSEQLGVVFWAIVLIVTIIFLNLSDIISYIL
ncbi:unnamed protein product [Paramecium octaurelia]|uniref:Uncharacterized protein n=1 Tax=Paramecium octaurelia TaxID=43137 RepID=A0A8S1YDT9_PAROT|nr:unnamed protein product [Paramecium octaurelia]